LYLMPVPDIRVRFASLDHFDRKKYLLLIKRCRLAVKPDTNVRFSNGFDKMAANYGSHLAFTVRKSDTKSVRKMTIWKPDGTVFGGVLY
jgi:hypothetical protein